MNLTYVRAGMAVLNTVTTALQQYAAGEMDDETFKREFLDPMKDHVDWANDLWENAGVPSDNTPGA